MTLDGTKRARARHARAAPPRRALTLLLARCSGDAAHAAAALKAAAWSGGQEGAVDWGFPALSPATARRLVNEGRGEQLR